MINIVLSLTRNNFSIVPTGTANFYSSMQVADMKLLKEFMTTIFCMNCAEAILHLSNDTEIKYENKYHCKVFY